MPGAITVQVLCYYTVPALYLYWADLVLVRMAGLATELISMSGSSLVKSHNEGAGFDSPTAYSIFCACSTCVNIIYYINTRTNRFPIMFSLRALERTGCTW